MVPNFKFFRGFTNELNLHLETREVVGNVRAIRALWTRELIQDIQAFNNIDAEAEISAILAQQISAEIDREILNDLHQFENVAFPMVRRVFSQVIANDLVAVQPMNMPTGRIYHFDFNKGGILNTFKFGR